MKKNISDKLFIAVGVLFLAVILAPSSAWAAGGNIFSIISAKMVSTIQDVRKIVYVIAGFGLIMFAVLGLKMVSMLKKRGTRSIQFLMKFMPCSVLTMFDLRNASEQKPRRAKPDSTLISSSLFVS